jgi:hypothetical protein
VDQRTGSLRLPGDWVQPAHNPTAQGFFRHAQVVGGLSYWVGWQETRIVPSYGRYA